MSYQLRDYQQTCVDAIFEQWKTHQSTLLCLFTAGGKTICFADVIRRMRPGRAIVLVNAEELLFQACDKIDRSTGLHCEIEMAENYAAHTLFNSADVIVCMVQSLMSGKGRKRMERFNPNDFSVVIVDEAHFSTSASFRKCIDYFRTNPNLKILGVTATPSRHDRESLGQIYESVAANYGMLDGINLGWLCDITQLFIPVAGLDYSHIRETKKGDLNEAELQAVMEEREAVAGICQPSLEVMFALPPKTLSAVPVPEWGDYIRGLNRLARKTIMFTASVKHAALCAEIFNGVVPGIAESVNGETPKDDRRKLLKKFAAGEVRAVMNCGVLTTGFDEPTVEVIIMARPTKSKLLYEQMVGRSTRTLPGTVDGPDLDTPEKRIAAIAASAKPYCIAEGTPILTDGGLVPIESVTSEMKVWDGVDFVTNSGIVFNGERTVIDYARLTATPEHHVWTKEGWKTFGQCATEQIPIAVTAFGREAIRETDGHYRGDSARERTGIIAGGVPVRAAVGKGPQQRDATNGWVPKMWTAGEISELALPSVPKCAEQMHQSQRTRLPTLRRKGDRIQIQVSSAHGAMDSGASRDSQREDFRPDRQRRALRSWKSEIRDEASAVQQPTRHEGDSRASRLSYRQSDIRRFRRSPSEAVSQGVDVEADTGECESCRPLQRKVRVFDILNAGPRNRFTAAGLLVSNCRIVDFVGNAGKHKLITTIDVLGGKITEAAKAKAIKKMQEDGNPVKVSRALDQAELDLKAEAQKDRERAKLRDAARRNHVVPKVRFSVQNVNPFEALGITPARPYARNYHKAPSEKMRRLLASRGINCEKHGITYSDAGRMIGAIAEREGWKR